MVIPIPAFNRGQHDAAKAQARATEVDHTVWATLRRGQADVAALVTRRDYIVKTLRTLTTSAVPRSAGILESSMKAFNAGQISTTDLILARRTHTALLLSVMDFRFDHFTVRNELLRVLGLDAPLAAQLTR